jgi:hypothetical protein
MSSSSIYSSTYTSTWPRRRASSRDRGVSSSGLYRPTTSSRRSPPPAAYSSTRPSATRYTPNTTSPRTTYPSGPPPSLASDLASFRAPSSTSFTPAPRQSYPGSESYLSAESRRPRSPVGGGSYNNYSSPAARSGGGNRYSSLLDTSRSSRNTAYAGDDDRRPSYSSSRSNTRPSYLDRPAYSTAASRSTSYAGSVHPSDSISNVGAEVMRRNVGNRDWRVDSYYGEPLVSSVTRPGASRAMVTVHSPQARLSREPGTGHYVIETPLGASGRWH